MIKGISKPLLITIIIATSAFFGFADTSFSIQYTSDKSKSDSYITYDSSRVPTFTQNQTVYIRITGETESDVSVTEDVDTTMNEATDSSSAADDEDAADTSSGETEDTDATTTPTLLQRASGSAQGESLSPAADGFYSLDTGKVGTYEVVLNEDVVMQFSVKATAGVIQTGKYYFYQDTNGNIRTTAGFLTWNGHRYYIQKGGRIITGKTFKIGKYTYRAAGNGQIHTGVYKWGKAYYYANSKGRLRKSKGFVSWNKHRYYLKKGGKIYTGKSFKVGKYTYRAAGNGQIHTGVYKWGKYYYYSSSKGRLRKSKGFVSWNKHRYYLKKGGKIYAGKTFKIGKYIYRSAGNGQIHTGAYKWGKTYYYANSKGRLRKSAGLIRWNGKTYYCRSSGSLYMNRFFFYGGNMYYAGSNAAAKTGTFKVGSYTYTADSSGNITSSDRKYMRGIDVSYWQGSSINWSKVKASGINFAFLRCGYSGTKKGECNKDSTFQRNIQQATAAGVDVGAYYFTQATSEKEAKAEAKFAVQQIQNSQCNLTLPLVVDTENISGRAASSKLSKAKRTKIIKAFCDTVKSYGYTPMIYASTSWLNNNLNMNTLSAYKVWVAQYNTEVTYKGKYQCWQYTSSGKVNGISGRVDLDYWTL